jgi:hypothetical protein
MSKTTTTTTMYAPLDNAKEATKTKPKVERPNRIESNQINRVHYR